MNRISFYVVERDFMDRNDPKITGNSLSYQQIADHLNKTWPELNEGKRTRGTIIDYYNRKRGIRIRMVAIPQEISERMSSQDLSNIIIYHNAKQTIL